MAKDENDLVFERLIALKCLKYEKILKESVPTCR